MLPRWVMTVFLLVSASLGFPAGDFLLGNDDPGSILYPNGGMEIVEHVPGRNEGDFRALLVDSSSVYAYIGTGTMPGQIYKIDVRTNKRVGMMSLPDVDSAIVCAVMHPANTYAYFVSGSVPPVVYRVDLRLFKVVASLELTGFDLPATAAAIDNLGRYAYVAGGCCTAGVVKVDLQTFKAASSLALNNGEGNVVELLFDENRARLYAAGGSGDGFVVAINPSTMTRLAGTVFPGEKITAGELSPDSTSAWLAKDTTPANLVSVNLGTLASGNSIPLLDGDGVPSSLRIQAGGRYLYTASSDDARIVRVDLNLQSRVGVIDLADGIPHVPDFVIHPSGTFIYALGGGYPGSHSRVRLSTFSLLDTLTFEADDAFDHVILREVAGRLWFANSIGPGHLVEFAVNPLSRAGEVRLGPGEEGIRAMAMSPDRTLAVVAYDNGTSAGLVKVDVVAGAVAGRVAFDAGMRLPVAVAFDLAGQNVYTALGDTQSVVLKHRASDLVLADSLLLDAELGLPVDFRINASGAAGYLATVGAPPRIVRIDMAALDFSAALELAEPVVRFSYRNAENRILAIQQGGAVTVRALDESTLQLVSPSSLLASDGLFVNVPSRMAGSSVHVATSAPDPRIYRIQRSLDTTMGFLGLPPGSDRVRSVIQGLGGADLYATTNRQPGEVLRIRSGPSGVIHGTRVTLGQTASGTEMNFFSHWDTGRVRFAVYTDDGPKALLWESPEVFNTARGEWITLRIDAGFPKSLRLYPGDYWLAWQTDAVDPVGGYAAGGEGFSFAAPYGAFPASLSSGEMRPMAGRWAQYLVMQFDGTVFDVLLGRAVGAPVFDQNADGRIDAADLFNP